MRQLTAGQMMELKKMHGDKPDELTSLAFISKASIEEFEAMDNFEELLKDAPAGLLADLGELCIDIQVFSGALTKEMGDKLKGIAKEAIEADLTEELPGNG